MAYDAAGRLLNYNNGAGRCTYDAEGNRARKDTASDWREYLYWDGVAYAEKNSDGTWSDYIYANGQKIARADNFDPRIHTYGTTPGGQGAAWDLAVGAYTVKQGDVLVWRQFQTGGAYGGPNLQFPTAQTHETALDTAGVPMDVLQTQNAWVSRVARLDNYAGQPLNTVQVVTDPASPAGTYDIYYGDMAIVSTDGSVLPVYTRQTSGTLANVWNTGQTNLGAAAESAPNSGTSPQYETTYYHGDHLGSARMVTSAEGWPMSSSTFYPFGVEEPGASDTNHFRYASLERDAESGLDAATFRQYSSVQGRWMSPDPYDGSYDASNPQSLNRYSYVLNNPLGDTDPTGLVGCLDAHGEPIDCPPLQPVSPDPLPVLASGFGGSGDPRGGNDKPSGSGRDKKTNPVVATSTVACSSLSLDNPATFNNAGAATPQQVQSFFSGYPNVPSSWNGSAVGSAFSGAGLNPGLAVGIIGAETSFNPGGPRNVRDPFSSDGANFTSSLNRGLGAILKIEGASFTSTNPLSNLINGNNGLRGAGLPGMQYDTTGVGQWYLNVNSFYRRFIKSTGGCK